MINSDEQQAYTVVQLSDFAENWHSFTLIVSIPPPVDPKTLVIQRIFLKRSKRPWLQKLDRRFGRTYILKKYHTNFANFNTKVIFSMMMTLFMMS